MISINWGQVMLSSSCRGFEGMSYLSFIFYIRLESSGFTGVTLSTLNLGNDGSTIVY